MAGLKERLEQAGFDTSGIDEKTILARLEKQGFDTTELKPKKSLSEQSLDTLKTLNKYTPGGQLIEARERLGETFDTLGEKVAELPEVIRGLPPEIAAGLGTAVSMAPDIAEIALLKRPTTRTAARAFPGERVLKRGIEQAEARAGIKQTGVILEDVAKRLGISETKRIVRAGKMANKQISKGEKLNAVLNRVLEMRATGQQTSPQLARDIVKLFETELKKGQGVAGMIAKAVGKAPTLQRGLMARAKKTGEKIVASAAPDRSKFAKALGRTIKTKKVTKAVAGILALELLRRALGGTLGGAIGGAIGGK